MLTAQDPAGGSLTDVATWVNFGIAGAIILGAILGYVWFKPSVDKLIEDRERALRERDKALEQRDAMAQVLQDKLLPVVGDFITTTRALLPILQELIRQQQLEEHRDPPRTPRRRPD